MLTLKCFSLIQYVTPARYSAISVRALATNTTALHRLLPSRASLAQITATHHTRTVTSVGLQFYGMRVWRAHYSSSLSVYFCHRACKTIAYVAMHAFFNDHGARARAIQVAPRLARPPHARAARPYGGSDRQCGGCSRTQRERAHHPHAAPRAASPCPRRRFVPNPSRWLGCAGAGAAHRRRT